MIESEDYKQVKEAEYILDQYEKQYQTNKYKTIVITFFSMLIFGLLGWGLPTLVYNLSFSFYSRTEFDTLISNTFGNAMMNDSLTDEVMIFCYSYNAGEPRFYSKYFIEKEPSIYDISFTSAL